MNSRRVLSLNRFLRRFTVRQRLFAMVTLLTAVMVLLICLSIIGQNRVLSAQERIVQAQTEADRLLLIVFARIGSSQASLYRYLGGTVPTAERAIEDAGDALIRLDAANGLVNEARAAQIQKLQADLVSYQELIGQLLAARARGAADESEALESQLLSASATVTSRVEDVIGSGQTVVNGAYPDLRQTARQSLSLAVGGGLAMLVVALVIAALVARSITDPIDMLRDAAERLGQGDLDVAVPETGRDELSYLDRVFNEMTAHLAGSHRELEQRVAQRTGELERTVQYMRAVINVSRATMEILDPELLVRRAVAVIRQRFDLTYVGLFLIDQEEQNIVLRAGTGEAGRRMLASGYHLALGQGMIGWCVANARARVSQEAGEDTVRVGNPYLPNIRSEAAIPLRARGRVVGALTVQDERPGVFDQTATDLLQVMADLLAVAIENVRLLDEVQTALDAAQRAYGQMTRQGWLRTLTNRTKSYALGDNSGEVWPVEMWEALESGEPVFSDRALVVPIVARDVILGGVRLTKPRAAWTQEEVALVQAIVEQLGLALDNARLLEDTQIRAGRDRLARTITDHMRATVDWDDLMQTAVQEIGHAVQASQIFVQWLPPDVQTDDASVSGDLDLKEDSADLSGALDPLDDGASGQ